MSLKVGQIFGKKRDHFMVGLSTLLLLASLLELAWLKQFFSFASQSQYKFFVRDIIFYQTLHVPVSFVFLFLIPEFNEWGARTEQRLSRRFQLDVVIATVFFFVIFYVGYSFLYLRLNDRLLFFVIVLIMEAFFRYLHGVGQIRGLSVILHQSLPQTLSLQQAVARERWLFRIFNVLVVSYAISMFLWRYLDKPFQVQYGWITGFGFYGSLFFVAAIVLNGFCFPKTVATKKFLFLTRLFLYALSFRSFAAAFGLGINHGVESALTQHTLYTNSAADVRRKRIIVVASFASVVLWIAIAIPGYKFLTDYDLSAQWLLALFATIRAFDFSHFWFERVAYRMRDRATRQYIGDLLVRP